MKRVQRLEYENARLREEIEQLRKTVQKKEKKIERLEFGKHIVTGYITEINQFQEWYMNESDSHVEFGVRAVTFPIELLEAFINKTNIRLKFTVELDNE